jgi:hypothetical protein
MMPWIDILQLLLFTTAAVFMEPLFWGILGIVAYQYWQMQKNQRAMFGVVGNPFGRQVLWAMLYGTIGGLLGSLVLTAIGVNIERMGIGYIWPLAIFLAMINLRFLCFAYAGGIVAISSSIFGWPDVDVPQVLALVASLHVTESLLIAISGRYGAVPVFLKQGGRLVGAFNLQNFWPLPLVVLGTVAMQTGSLPEGAFHMPDWWPLLSHGIAPPAGTEWVYVMMPVVAALGYSDMAISSTPGERRRKSAISLAFYSISLMVLALLAAKFAWLKLPAALLSPLGHEYLVRRDNKAETEGTPRYVPPDRGVMVLDTTAGSISRQLGLRTGDIILGISGLAVNKGGDLGYAIGWAPPVFELTMVRDGKERVLEGRFEPGSRMLGIILVPEGNETYYVTMSTGPSGPIARLFERMTRYFRRDA